MPVATFQGTIEDGQIKLAPDIQLPENAKVFVIVPDFEESVITKKISLEEFLSQMPSDYQVSEENWGQPVGKEEW